MIHQPELFDLLRIPRRLALWESCHEVTERAKLPNSHTLSVSRRKHSFLHEDAIGIFGHHLPVGEAMI